VWVPVPGFFRIPGDLPQHERKDKGEKADPGSLDPLFPLELMGRQIDLSIYVSIINTT